MIAALAPAVRDLLRKDPRVAILVGEILGPPVGSPEALPRLWEA